MAQESGWCTIESDPGVFTELLSAIGVRNVQVEELYTLNREQLAQFGTVYGVVFLFKYRQNEHESARNRPGAVCTDAPARLFFARQTVQNACATQAILSIVLNSEQLDIGPELQTSKEFSAAMDAAMRGLVISNIDAVRAAHNSFAPQQQFVLDDSPDAQKEDPFHFIAYIPFEGRVYELDGLQEAPRVHGAFSQQQSWLDVLTPVIEQRIGEYDGTEIRFNLMAVVEDPRERLAAQLDTLRAAQQRDDAEVLEVENELQLQNEKHERWRTENIRRRWNFVPFIVNLLKETANLGKMSGIINAVAERKRADYREVEASKGKNAVE